MSTEPDRATRKPGRGSSAPFAPLALCASVLLLSLGSALPVAATPGAATAAGRLHLALARTTKMARRGVAPPAARLAGELPEAADDVGRLREPASTAQAQLRTTLDELRRMSALTIDPHYLPALVAAGRAYIAVSGQDPLTGTTIQPGYAGLEPELVADAARLERASVVATKLSSRVKRLTRALARAQRRAARLERQRR